MYADLLEHDPDDPQYYAWVVAGTTGMRRSEILGVRWSDVDLTAGRLAVRQRRRAPRTVRAEEQPQRPGDRPRRADRGLAAQPAGDAGRARLVRASGKGFKQVGCEDGRLKRHGRRFPYTLFGATGHHRPSCVRSRGEQLTEVNQRLLCSGAAQVVP